jgi:GPH family glycoside/pentoside/hexuronide:cation symporter
VLFFLAAAVSAPAWSRLAARHGAKPVLLSAMALAIASFAGVLSLSEGQVVAFAVICVASGATIGADLTLLPALFARRMATIAPTAAQGFGLWSFTTKATLAIAAAVLLPSLQAAGFDPGADNPDSALRVLTLLYALLPCALKLVAVALLIATDLKED